MLHIKNREWYAIRVTYGREMKLKKLLDPLQIENFIPMCYQMDAEKQTRILVPAIHNLIFIKSSRIELDQIKIQVENCTPMRYIIDPSTHLPMIVSETAMRNFIAVASMIDEDLIYLDPCKSNFTQGDRVRITEGLFAGVEGEIRRIKRNRRVVVSIRGIVAVATAFIEPAFLEKIDHSNR